MGVTEFFVYIICFGILIEWIRAIAKRNNEWLTGGGFDKFCLDWMYESWEEVDGWLTM